MLGTLAALVVQLLRDDAPAWATGASLALAASAILLAGAHTFPSARRLGAQRDDRSHQTRLARAICRDHLLCLGAITSLLVVQLAFAR